MVSHNIIIIINVVVTVNQPIISFLNRTLTIMRSSYQCNNIIIVEGFNKTSIHKIVILLHTLCMYAFFMTKTVHVLLVGKYD